MTNEQVKAQDILEHGVFDLVVAVAKHHKVPEPEWNMEWIGLLADTIAETVADVLPLTEEQLYPYIEEE